MFYSKINITPMLILVNTDFIIKNRRPVKRRQRAYALDFFSGITKINISELIRSIIG